MSLNIGILVFPAVQQLDLTGPYEVFASIPGAEVHLIWKDKAPLASVTKLLLTPTTTLSECPVLDVLFIPGGPGVNPLLEDREILDFVREKAEQARYVTSVCTGALVLGAAGLLVGRKATTHWYAHNFLARLGAIPVHERVVRDGNLFTSGGITAGIDFGLTVAAELVGQAEAEAIQLGLEYDPQPPFHAGTPAQAKTEIVDEVKRRSASSRREREGIISRIAPKP